MASLISYSGRLPAGYRYLEPKYADIAMAGGGLRMCMLSTYNDMEERPDDLTADKLDASVMLSGDNVRMERTEHTTADEMRRWNAAGIHLSAIGASMTIGRIENVRRLPPLYVLCMSLFPDNPYCGAEGRLAVIEIKNLMAFASAVLSAHASQVSTCAGGIVAYTDAVAFDIYGDYREPSAFVKRERYAPQQEIRLAFTPRHGQVAPINIDGNAIRPFLRRVR